VALGLPDISGVPVVVSGCARRGPSDGVAGCLILVTWQQHPNGFSASPWQPAACGADAALRQFADRGSYPSPGLRERALTLRRIRTAMDRSRRETLPGVSGLIQRAANTQSRSRHHMRVDLRGRNISPGMNPSRGLDAFSLPIYEPIFIIKASGQSLWKALLSPHGARYGVQYEAHYLLALRRDTSDHHSLHSRHSDCDGWRCDSGAASFPLRSRSRAAEARSISSATLQFLHPDRRLCSAASLLWSGSWSCARTCRPCIVGVSQ